MKSFLKIVVYSVLSLAVIVGVVYLLGNHMPETHIASRVVNVPASQQKVWQLITDYNALPTWSSDIKSIEALPSQNGETCYVEVRSHLRLPMCTTLSDQPRKLIHTINNAESPFQGTWTYELTPLEPEKTQLTITETGRIPNPIYRYLAYQIGIDSNIKSFEEDLLKAAAK